MSIKYLNCAEFNSIDATGSTQCITSFGPDWKYTGKGQSDCLTGQGKGICQQTVISTEESKPAGTAFDFRILFIILLCLLFACMICCTVGFITVKYLGF